MKDVLSLGENDFEIMYGHTKVKKAGSGVGVGAQLPFGQNESVLVINVKTMLTPDNE